MISVKVVNSALTQTIVCSAVFRQIQDIPSGISESVKRDKNSLRSC